MSRLQPYLDVLMQHLSDLMIEADAWPDDAQILLYSFWSQLDNLTLLLPMPRMPLREGRLYLSGLWEDLGALLRMTLYGDSSWHLDRLQKALVYISYLVDEHLCGYFELRSISARTTELVQAVQIPGA